MDIFQENTIAIVDDSAVVRAFVSFLLFKHDLNIEFEAANGQECLAKITTAGKAPQVVILDIQMPVMDGFKTAAVIKNDWPDTKIIALSSKDDASTVGQITKAGADCFISKQKDITLTLIETIGAFLPH